MTLSRTRGRCGGGQERGFTLIELIIALALVALITLLLFSGLRLGSRAWDGVDAVAERNAELRSARGFLDRVLMQSRDLTLIFDGEARQIFAGGPDSLELVAPLSEHVGIPGLYILRLGLDRRGERSRLVLTRWLLHPDVLAGSADTPEWKPLDPSSADVSRGSAQDQDLAAGAYGQTVLLEGVGDFQLAYFGVIEAGDLAAPTTGVSARQVTGGRSGRTGLAEGQPEGQWYEEWVDQPHPPQLVQVRLTSRRQDWPDSFVALPQVDHATVAPMVAGLPQVAPNPSDGTVPGAPGANGGGAVNRRPAAPIGARNQ